MKTPQKNTPDRAAADIPGRDDFQRCAAFHGHICPGLAIGYRAARLAMERLQESRANVGPGRAGLCEAGRHARGCGPLRAYAAGTER